jgi:4-amino-4-deoxy-L-arabinose transferase-like glycosyltransferase
VSAERFLARHRGWAVALILLLSALVRLPYLLELAGGPCGASARYVNSDMRFFDRWAREIAAGDLLGRAPLHPLHDWHRNVAALHFRAEGRSAAEPEDAQALWNRWYGGPRFHQEPLYPYAVALLYRLTGGGPIAVYCVQLLLGMLSNLLIYLLARRYFSDTVAVTAALLALGCAPLLFYEGVLLRSTAIGFLGLLAVFLTQRAFDGGGRGRFLVAGLVIGLGLLLKSTLALLGLGALLLLLRRRRPARLALVEAGALALGVMACLVPLALRNAAVDAPPLSLSSVGAVTFLGANFDGNDPELGFQLDLGQTATILGRTEGRLWPTVQATLRTHANAGSWLLLCARKLGAAWHGFEIPNNVNFYLCSEESRLLRLLPVRFAWIAPLAIAGMLAAAWTRRDCALLYLLVLTHLLPLLVFYVLSRFRLPMIAATLPFAALALVQLGDWLRQRRLGRAAILAGVVLLVALWSCSPRGAAAGPRIRLPDMVQLLDHWYLPQSMRAREAGDVEREAQLVRRALRLEPRWIEELLREGRRPAAQQRDQLLLFAQLHAGAAETIARSGRAEEARRIRERGLRLERVARQPPR